MTKLSYNYHTHLYLCRHAVGDFEDYIKAAIRNNYSDLGFSDHAPLPDTALNKISKTRRMSLNEFYEIYLSNYNKIKELYINKINLYIGLEIEYLEETKEFIKKAINEHLVDYLILGQHYYNNTKDTIDTIYSKEFNDNNFNLWTNSVIEALNTGYFKILAHPDIFLWHLNWKEEYIENCRKIIECCIKNKVYLEINANGIRNCKKLNHLSKEIINNQERIVYDYPNLHFLEVLKEYNNTDLMVIIGEDAHDPLNIWDDATKECLEIIKEYGINIIEHPIIK